MYLTTHYQMEGLVCFVTFTWLDCPCPGKNEPFKHLLCMSVPSWHTVHQFCDAGELDTCKTQMHTDHEKTDVFPIIHCSAEYEFYVYIIYVYTVELLNNGHIGDKSLVLCRLVAPTSEIGIEQTRSQTTTCLASLVPRLPHLAFFWRLKIH